MSIKPKLLLASEGSGVNGFNHPLEVSLDRHSSRLVVLVDTHRHAQELEGVDLCRWNGLPTDGKAWKDSLPCRRLHDQGPALGHLGLQVCPLQPTLDHVQLMLTTGRCVADDAQIISIEEVVDRGGGRRERKSKVFPGAESV